MNLTALLLSRLQFAFTISFHIIFPSFTIGLAAWLTVLEALHLRTGRPAYRQVFEFWLKIFGVAFGLGVVSGIVMAFQFGTNWSVLARMSGPIQGPLLSYETFTAFFLEASYAKRGGTALGRQRDLAHRRRRYFLGRLSDRLCDAALGVLSAALVDVGRPDLPRRGLRISQ
jgi:cytochrome d ubiquinol oxidase subunit I